MIYIEKEKYMKTRKFIRINKLFGNMIMKQIYQVVELYSQEKMELAKQLL